MASDQRQTTIVSPFVPQLVGGFNPSKKDMFVKDVQRNMLYSNQYFRAPTTSSLYPHCTSIIKPWFMVKSPFLMVDPSRKFEEPAVNLVPLPLDKCLLELLEDSLRSSLCPSKLLQRAMV